MRINSSADYIQAQTDTKLKGKERAMQVQLENALADRAVSRAPQAKQANIDAINASQGTELDE